MVNFKNFQSFDKGSKIILISAGVAILSLFFNWVSVLSAIGVSGLRAGAIKCLVVFIYPVFVVVAEKAINKIAGFVCAGVGVLITIYVYNQATTPFSSIGLGVYIFLASCISLAAGVHFYSQAKSGTTYRNEGNSYASFTNDTSSVCPNCGSTVKSGGKFCTSCGTEVR